MTALLLVLGIIALVYLGAGLAIFADALLRPDKRDLNYDGVSDEAAFQPSGHTPFRMLSHESNIWWNKQSLEAREIKSAEGLLLKGRLLRAESATDKLAIVVHGHLDVSGEMGFIARMYHDHGYDVFMADQRSHGKSEGRLIGMGAPESRDLLLWIKDAAERKPDCEIVLHGISMGAATVMLAGALSELPQQVKCAVEDCGYTNAYDAIFFTAKRYIKHLPFKRLAMDIAGLVSLLVSGRSLKRISPLEAMKAARIPFLVIHGTADPTVPFYMGEALYEACAAPKEKYFLEGAAHGVVYFSDPEAYAKAVFSFEDKYLK